AAYAAVLDIEGKTYVKAHRLAMASTEPTVRAAGANGARKAAADEVRPHLVRLLEDPDATVRRAALDALDDLYPSDAGPLRAGLASSWLATRVRAAEPLAARRDESIVQPMLALLRDPDLERRFPAPVVAAWRRGAATALATLGSQSLLEAYASELV